LLNKNNFNSRHATKHCFGITQKIINQKYNNINNNNDNDDDDDNDDDNNNENFI